jgi:hypothetical protein
VWTLLGRAPTYAGWVTRRIACILALATAGCGHASNVSPLPAGTYHYESLGEPDLNESAVTVSRDASGVLVREVAHFGPSAIVETRLDSATYSVVSSSVREDPPMGDPSIAISRSGATYTLPAATRVTENAPAAGAPSWIFGMFASFFTMIPAMVHATHATTVNTYFHEVYRGKAHSAKLYVVDRTARRPSGVSWWDASLGLAWQPDGKPAISIWYDPKTLIVDAVDVVDRPAFLRK